MLRAGLVVAVLLLPGYAAARGRQADSPASTVRAQLRVADLRPLAVSGSGFRAGETVRVTAITDAGAGAKSAETGAAGRFGMRFPKLKLDGCPNYLISARGDKGSRATQRSVPRPCGADR
jgi:hypothetical protein